MTIPLYLQFALNKNDKALQACIKHGNTTMYDYWYSERLRIHRQYFMPRMSDTNYKNLTIY